MENSLRWSLVTAVAPIAWATTYFVTRQYLPADSPLWGAAIRALPAGIVLLLIARRLPRGSWWWKSLVLGTLNMGAFFALVYIAAQLLPTSVAAPIMAISPVAMMLLAWLLLSVRPKVIPMIGAFVGIGGVTLLLVGGGGAVNPLGVLASIAAMTMSSVGYVLAKRWNDDTSVLASTSWQLLAGGIVLLIAAVAVEGAPPTLDGAAILGFAYVSLIATALAFVAWFAGLAHLDAGTVGLIGLLNPVTGVLLGVLVASEALAPQQYVGLALVLLGIVAGQPIARRLVSIRAFGVTQPPDRGGTGPNRARPGSLAAVPPSLQDVPASEGQPVPHHR